MTAAELRTSIEFWSDRMADPDVAPEESFFAYETMLEQLAKLEVMKDAQMDD